MVRQSAFQTLSLTNIDCAPASCILFCEYIVAGYIRPILDHWMDIILIPLARSSHPPNFNCHDRLLGAVLSSLADMSAASLLNHTSKYESCKTLDRVKREPLGSAAEVSP